MEYKRIPLGGAKDITNQKYNMLTPLFRVEQPINCNYHESAFWYCKCDCGSFKITSAHRLKKGRTKSCGCIIKESNKGKVCLEFGRASFNRVYKSYFKRSKYKNIEFSLSEEQAYKLFKSNCFYCDKKPNNIQKDYYSHGEFIYNGIDRVNSKIGYNIDNCVSCCKICNFAKNNLSIEEFKQHIINLYNNFIVNKKEQDV